MKNFSIPYRLFGIGKVVIKIKKRESLYLLLVPQLEALALPILVERAIAEASRKYAQSISIFLQKTEI